MYSISKLNYNIFWRFIVYFVGIIFYFYYNISINVSWLSCQNCITQLISNFYVVIQQFQLMQSYKWTSKSYKISVVLIIMLRNQRSEVGVYISFLYFLVNSTAKSCTCLGIRAILINLFANFSYYLIICLLVFFSLNFKFAAQRLKN